jgi:hypothetical protein
MIDGNHPVGSRLLRRREMLEIATALHDGCNTTHTPQQEHRRDRQCKK